MSEEPNTGGGVAVAAPETPVPTTEVPPAPPIISSPLNNGPETTEDPNKMFQDREAQQEANAAPEPAKQGMFSKILGAVNPTNYIKVETVDQSKQPASLPTVTTESPKTTNGSASLFPKTGFAVSQTSNNLTTNATSGALETTWTQGVKPPEDTAATPTATTPETAATGDGSSAATEIDNIDVPGTTPAESTPPVDPLAVDGTETPSAPVFEPSDTTKDAEITQTQTSADWNQSPSTSSTANEATATVSGMGSDTSGPQTENSSTAVSGMPTPEAIPTAPSNSEPQDAMPTAGIPETNQEPAPLSAEPAAAPSLPVSPPETPVQSPATADWNQSPPEQSTPPATTSANAEWIPQHDKPLDDVAAPAAAEPVPPFSANALSETPAPVTENRQILEMDSPNGGLKLESNAQPPLPPQDGSAVATQQNPWERPAPPPTPVMPEAPAVTAMPEPTVASASPEPMSPPSSTETINPSPTNPWETPPVQTPTMPENISPITASVTAGVQLPEQVAAATSGTGLSAVETPPPAAPTNPWETPTPTVATPTVETPAPVAAMPDNITPFPGTQTPPAETGDNSGTGTPPPAVPIAA